MSELRITTNQAHDSGFSTLCFSRDGKRLYTGGNDSLVRVWDTALGAEQEPHVLGEATLDVMSIACSDSSCYTASKDSSVRHYDASNEFTELVTEAAGLCVRCIALSPDNQWLAVCTEDTTVKIVNTTTTSRVARLDGHKKGARSATWDPKGRYLTTCGQDGQIIVWDIKDSSQPTQVKVIEQLIPAIADSESPEFQYNCSAVWHPSGAYFATVSTAHDIIFVSSSTWNKTETLYDGHDSAVSSLTFSPNGLYLASGGTDGKVIVWDLLDKKPKWSAPSGQQKKPVTAIGFHPQKNMLAWMIDGMLQQWSAPVPASHPHPSSTRTTVAPPKTTSSIKADKPTAPDDDDLAGLEEDYGDDWIVDDIGDGAHLEEPVVKEKGKEKSRKRHHSGEGGIREMVNITKAQPPFQPGSTAFRNKKRYMAYNMKGVIECTNLDAHYVINVEFHDRSSHQNIHFQDVNRFDTASLGEYGVAFACPPDNGHFAMIEYRPYSEWSPNAQWQFKLPEGEHVIALAVGGTPAARMIQMSGGKYEGFGMVAAATNKGYIRFISGGGVQEYIMSTAGDVVSMVGGNEWIFVVHREGGTSLDGCQNLRYSLIAVDGFDLVQEGRLPVPKGETLKWIGITTEGAPAMADSAGVLYVLDRYRRPTQARWVPILDSNTLARRVGKDETYWPIGLSNSQFNCIILKGRETEPGFPRPLVQDLEVRTPLLIAEQESGEQEEQLFRELLQLIALQDSQLHEEEESDEVTRAKISVDKLILTLIQGACKSGHHARAIDLASMLRSTSSIEKASQLAGFYHLRGLQERFAALREAREEDDGATEVATRDSWDRASDAIPNKVGQYNGGGRRNGRQQYFDEFAPPPVITRRSLAAATPIVVPDESPAPSGSMQIDETPPPVDSKRKRTEEDTWDIEMADDGFADFKRQNTSKAEAGLGSTKATTGNPFARKSATGNPFAKKNTHLLVPATKSTSFFDKVDAAESAGPKRGAKFAPKTTSRQTTLFGLSSKGASPAQPGTPTETNDGETQLEDPESTQ
ncbi:Minichromosome loss protein 1 [Ceratobasidium theobromae]|uniref:Minichromosome loss protein 1 n=1 Tax=Ceratobasidium theobromae TaxID=1582974 RepID=A0A5N5QDF1_9AGAM|nr:Minichromosome loss protein 1 [Ceratobasidium theobromae]